jgi:hypothetical protein
MTELDTRIVLALESLGQTSKFDKRSYIKQFAPSAAEKAQTVIRQLGDEEAPFKGLRPVFVSVGGVHSN